MKNRKFGVIGSGSWALALSTILADNGVEVLMWSRGIEDVDRINKEHKSKYFEDVVFSNNIKATNDLDECFAFSDDLLVAIPVKVIQKVLENYFIKYNNKNYLIASKGLLNGETLSDLIESYNDSAKTAALSGPSFAVEVINKAKTAVNIASCDIELAKKYQLLFSNANFRVYATSDITGVEYCGAVKNVYAIASGLIDQTGFSYNAKSALLTRAVAELENLIVSVGGAKETLYGLSGIGDLMLTCYSDLSRNYTFGFEFRGSTDTDKTVEGINALKEMHKIAKDKGIEMPIINSIYGIVYENRQINEEIDSLMLRKVKVIE